MLKLETLAKNSEIYKLYHLCINDDIPAKLTYTDDEFCLKIENKPNFVAVSGKKTTGDNSITYRNYNRTVSNLTAEKTFARIKNLMKGGNDERERQEISETKI